jgi:hypothetical protein
VISIGSLTGTTTFNSPTLITLASGAGTGLAVSTASGTGVAATFASTNSTTDAIELTGGGIKTAPTVVGAGASPQTANNRFGQVVFSGVSIAAGATQTLTITNSTVTGSSTVVLVTMYGATTGSAPVIQSVTPSAGSIAIIVMNGAAVTTDVANKTFTFWVMN